MIVGIAKIEALAAARPVYFAFDRDSSGNQFAFPLRKVRSRNCKGDVQRSGGLMRRDLAAGCENRFVLATALENEQYLLVSHAEYADAFVGLKKTEADFFLVEADGARKITGVQARFSDAVNLQVRHGYFPEDSRLSPCGVYRFRFAAAIIALNFMSRARGRIGSGIRRTDRRHGSRTLRYCKPYAESAIVNPEANQMATKSKLRDAAVKIGTAVGRADGTAHKAAYRAAKAAHIAREELVELSKQVESLKKQLQKSTQKLKSALK
jgi:hypothetical protein